jgi:hypothetical protein
MFVSEGNQAEWFLSLENWKNGLGKRTGVSFLLFASLFFKGPLFHKSVAPCHGHIFLGSVFYWGFVEISRDYPLKIRTSKQSTGEISGYEIIPSYPLKYSRSK